MELKEIRQKIDQIDEQMKELFLQRMDLAHEVIENKKLTGAPVYVAKREQEVLELRTAGVKEEYLPACRAFFQHMMEISRSYQYAEITEQAEQLHKLLDGNKRADLSFSCKDGGSQAAVFLNAAMLAGLRVEEAGIERQGDDLRCRLSLYGDFSLKAAKAAVMQIQEENESVKIL